MFKKHNVVRLSLLLVLTLTLTGCLGLGKQSVDAFFKEFTKAHASLNTERVLALTHFPDTSEGRLVKEFTSIMLESEFSVFRKANVKLTRKVELDPNSIHETKEDAIISGAIFIEKLSFDPDYVEAMIEKETEPELRNGLESLLNRFPDGEYEDRDELSEGEEIHLMRVGKKWKIKVDLDDFGFDDIF